MFAKSSHTLKFQQQRRSAWHGRGLAVLVLFTVIVSSLQIQPTVGAAAPTLRAAPTLLAFAQRYPDELFSVIVQNAQQASTVKALVQQLGGEVTGDLSLIKGLAVRIPGRSIAQLAAAPQIKWISQDAPVYKSSTDDGTIVLREDFDGVIYQTQADPATTWPGGPSWGNAAWQELGEADGPNEGDIVIAPFLAGQYIGVRLQGAGKGLQTAFSLTDATQASLSLEYRRKNLNSEADFAGVEVSADAGATWHELGRISGPGTDESIQTVTYDLSAYLSNTLQLRLVNGSANGIEARVYVDYLQVRYTPVAEQQQDPAKIYTTYLPALENATEMASVGLTEVALDEQSEITPARDPQAVDATSSIVDYFDVNSFCNNNGWMSWVNCWVENDPGSGTAGVSAGHVQVNSSGLSLDDSPDTGGEPSASRKANLISAASAKAQLRFWTTSGVDPSDTVVFEVSTNGGTSYTILDTFSGITGYISQTRNYDLSRFVPNELTFRLRVSAYYGGSDEKFYVDHLRVWFDNVTSAAGWNVVVPSGSTWKYLDNGSDQGTAWRQLYYNDSSWAAGAGELGYGDGDEATVVSYGPNAANKYVTTYFRRSFHIPSVSSLSSPLALGMVRPDDGAVVYINGTEVLRVNMPTGTINYSTWAASNIDVAEGDWLTYNIPTTTLVNGQNVMAVEVHQAYAGSTDISFEAELAAYSNCGDCVSTGSLVPYLKSIRADQVWNSTSRTQGMGVTVAIVDSGIAPNADLRTNVDSESVIARVNFVGSSGLVDDYNGHGSHIAGIIAGNGGRSRNTFMGVAPKAKLIDVKVLDDQGRGTTSAVVSGLQWINDNRVNYNIKVLNMSLNSAVMESYNTNPLNAALEILWFNKVISVVSAGNTSTTQMYPPANDPFVITVGAVDDKGTVAITDDTVATFSSYGTTVDGFAKPDLVAPGRNIISVLASDDCNLVLQYGSYAITLNGVRFFKMSGTSMASAVVAGAVALLLQDEPNLNPDQVKYRLKATASTAWAGYTAAKAGAGYLDIFAAVNGTTTQTANTGTRASAALFSGSQPPVWGSVNWSSVNWSSVNWSSVNWSSVNWSSVNWSSVDWP